MIEKDYIMRILQQFFAALNNLINNKRNVGNDEILVQLKDLYLSQLGNEYAFFYYNDIEKIKQSIIDDNHDNTLARCTILSELYYHDGILNSDQELKINLLKKALHLLRYIDEKSNTYSLERKSRIQFLDELTTYEK